MGRDGLGEAGHGGDGLETSVDGGGGGADGLGQFLAAGIGGIELQIAEDEPAGQPRTDSRPTSPTVPQSCPPRQDLLHSPLKRHGYHFVRLPHPDRYPVRGNVLPTKRQDV